MNGAMRQFQTEGKIAASSSNTGQPGQLPVTPPISALVVLSEGFDRPSELTTNLLVLRDTDSALKSRTN